jgi:hypothetical protein
MTLTLVENLELKHNSAFLGCNFDQILRVQSILVDCHLLQVKLLQSILQKDRTTLKKMVQAGPAFDQQSGHLHCTPLEHYCPQQIHPLVLTQTKLLAGILPEARVNSELGVPMHP